MRGPNRALTESAIALALRSTMMMPASGLATTSGLPQIGVAMAGVPQAIASSSTLAQPSRLEARISASAAP